MRMLLALFVLAAAVFAGVPPGAAQDQAPEQQVKAAFLTRFAGYVAWP